MPSEKLRVAFLWHFHQPIYKDFLTNEYVMPWVRLHALKDYYDMGAILAGVDGATATFNFVGSLILQLNDYASGKADDLFVHLSEKPAESLSEDERRFLITNFFYINRKIIESYPRFSELLVKREMGLAVQNPMASYSLQDFLDLQVLFNLGWCGNTLRRESDVVKALQAKGRDFSEEEKIELLSAQQQFLSRISELYLRLASERRVELSITPFYHPILPLLANVQNARECMPGVPLPANWTGVAEDAVHQVRESAKLFEAQFGGVPLRGMWPAEGSVSQDTCGIYTDLGIKWIATDEAVLSGSLSAAGRPHLGQDRSQLFSPHFVEVNGKPLSIFFRDHGLSDAIGFVYSPWEATAAADDFLAKLKAIHDSVGASTKGNPPIVSVILDGENAWQYYADNGEPFLKELYSRLVASDWLELVTFGDYVDEFGPGHPLKRLSAGSWIRGDFGVWIGHPEDNQAWDYLAAARDALVKDPPADAHSKALAWQTIYAAEGSDWNWWYGDDHSCDNIDQFDRLYRKHIANVFTLIGKSPPFDLSIPIKKLAPIRAYSQPKQFIHPVIDGKDTTYFEWIGAGVLDQRSAGRGAMHQVSTHAKKLYYGFDPANMFIRIDFTQDAVDLLGLDGDLGLYVHILEPEEFRLQLAFEGAKTALLVDAKADNGWEKTASLPTVAAGKILELAAPLEMIGCKAGDRLRFAIRLTRGGELTESIPEDSCIKTTVPGPEFEEEEWLV
ncbi:MAG: glycoside hydrolase [Candidatus Coatesbacteria bacterium]|nr:glycoside hydrolase [Candidatus Coatesbacteria bacterium]